MEDDAVIARANDLTGVVLGGRYEVLGKLGVGGMASVYEGRRVGLHNRVAIKVLRADLCEDPSNVKRFIREARASSVIEHENIVDIVDFGPVDSLPVYFVMEFLEGTDLRGEIKSKGAMGWDRARRILLQVVGALGAAHDKAIVHRDVKPANIYLIKRQNGEEVAKVLDFGIAKVIEEQLGGLTRAQTMTNGLLGTVAYMAPEQARGETIDARTDIYAVGALAYQMLTGRVPFQGNNPYVVLEQHVSERPQPPSELVESIPPEAEAIVLRCLEKAPADRFQSMQEVAEALAHGTTLDYATPITDPVKRNPGWSPPHPEALEANAGPSQDNTEALGSGSSHRARGVASASHPVVTTTAVGDAPVHTQRTQPRRSGSSTMLPASPSLTMATAASTADLRPRSGAMLPALLGLGVGLGLLLSLGIVFFVLEPREAESTDPTPPTPASVVPAGGAANEVDPPPRPDEVRPEPKPPSPPPAEVVVAEPKTPAESDTSVAEKPGNEPRVQKPKRPRKPRKPAQPTETKAEPKTTPTEPTPKPPPPTDDEDLHPDLRNPYG